MDTPGEPNLSPNNDAIAKQLDRVNTQFKDLQQQMTDVTNEWKQHERDRQSECCDLIRSEFRSPDSPIKKIIEASVRAEVCRAWPST